MAVTKVVMPKLSEAMETGKLLRWLKQEGERVAGGDIVAEIETDKADIELEAFGSGVLRKVLVGPGATVPVGNLIAVIAEPDDDISGVLGAAGAPTAPAAPPKRAEEPARAAAPTGGQPPAAAPAPSAPSTRAEEPVRAAAPTGGQPATAATVPAQPSVSAADARQAPAAVTAAATPPAAEAAREEEAEETPVAGRRLRASPLAKKLAQKSGIDLTLVKGTGPAGRIIQRDVESFVASRPAEAARPAAPAVRPAPRPEARPAAEYEDQALSQLRAAIARQMTQSKAPVPHFYLTTEVAMERAVALREELQALPGAPKLTFTDLIVRACAVTLTKHPGVNASFQGQAIRRYRAVHIGIAVALEDGLITPVLRDCDQKGLFQIAAESRDLAERTRVRKLKAQELSGATFSVSNLGMFAVDEFSAIINPPEGAILAVGAIVDKPVVVKGQLAVGKRLRLTLSCDHRAMDGAMGARFLGDLQALLEAPLGLLV
ncbi:MAG TPA: dihydrolipoamide acetyltransferase family protein [Methylomirabilota bacterium]|jgi:pyruvate dehydrogenase E2 component (dihydrolipoamide acetyltransferase)|nr:dihydrolipoamide acetyltransferase family protein [Methylomirabilota bacterium]